MKVYIVEATRSPLGAFLGGLSETPAPELLAQLIKGLKLSDEIKSAIDEAYIGHVLSANVGQAPSKQALLYADLPSEIPATGINKVCASGMKATMLGAMSISSGINDLVIVGGMENMSLAPFYSSELRKGKKLGNLNFTDGLIFDGLTSPYDKEHMGVSAELCATEHKISREEQDEYALLSYQRAIDTRDNGLFTNEITPIKTKRGTITNDEGIDNLKLDKLPNLRPAFQKKGSVTAGNASTINDGASVLLLASKKAVIKHGLTPLAEIISYADASQKPEHFTTSPTPALKKAINKTDLKIEDIDFFEINEAFSVVALANKKLLSIPLDKLNIHGGAVSLGHPLGASGCRILVSLIYILQQQGGTYGAASICNGGGGASAMVIKSVN
jgi:acetyl-CoA C-acetyltransferase